MNQKPTVVVAMSGGVDSSVAAAILVNQGYSVIGIMLRLWSEEAQAKSNRCCTPDSVSQAQQVASILSIPFYVLDAKQVFYDKVVTPFISDYANNRTPNPCIACNRSVRWDFLYHHALATGADYLATGHYARITQSSSGSFQLLRGLDPAKDQSYVLHVLTQEQLTHALFPLGEYHKPEVRKLAQELGLPVAERPDSQDLCFVGGNGDYRQFLARHTPNIIQPGLIVDVNGNSIGTHSGLANYTIGQRKGINVSSPIPLYVLRKDQSTNTLVVGDRQLSASDFLIAEKVNWIENQLPKFPLFALVKIRYKSHEILCTVNLHQGESIKVDFTQQVHNITPGQAAVLYNGDVCLGGGIITQ